MSSPLSLSLSSLCFTRAFIGYKLNFHFVSFYFVSFVSFVSCLFCSVRFLLILFFSFFVGFVLLLLLFYSICFISFCFVSLASLALLKTFERCIVKPLGQLVRVSSMAHTTYTPRLSTSSS